MKGRTQYGESYRAVEMESAHKPKTRPVQMVRRYPDGREEETHVIQETIAYEFTTREEAIDKAVELHRAGVSVSLDYMPDGRGGHQGGYLSLVDSVTFAALISAAERRDA